MVWKSLWNNVREQFVILNFVTSLYGTKPLLLLPPLSQNLLASLTPDGWYNFLYGPKNPHLHVRRSSLTVENYQHSDRQIPKFTDIYRTCHVKASFTWFDKTNGNEEFEKGNEKVQFFIRMVSCGRVERISFFGRGNRSLVIENIFRQS